MVEVIVEVAADAAVRDELFGWVARIPRVDELDLRVTAEKATATLHSPPQLATLAMAVAVYLRTKPADQRPAVTITAPNGESFKVTDRPDPDAIRRSYIAMDKQAPAALTAPSDVIDAEIVDEPTDTPSLHLLFDNCAHK